MKQLPIAADHAGFALKEQLRERRPELPWRDFGPASDARVDYPDFADKLASAFVNELAKAGPGDSPAFGVLVCGSGQGMAMRANRYPALRAAVCWNVESARLARAHNDANILCLGARVSSESEALAILEAFLTQPFEGGRHADRVAKLARPCC